MNKPFALRGLKGIDIREALFEVLEFVGGMVLPFNAPQKIAC